MDKVEFYRLIAKKLIEINRLQWEKWVSQGEDFIHIAGEVVLRVVEVEELLTTEGYTLGNVFRESGNVFDRAYHGVLLCDGVGDVKDNDVEDEVYRWVETYMKGKECVLVINK